MSWRRKAISSTSSENLIPGSSKWLQVANARRIDAFIAAGSRFHSFSNCEQLEIEFGCPPQRHILEDLANRARKFETVARAGTGQNNSRIFWVMIDQEMMIGRVGVHANHRAPQRAIGLRQKSSHDSPHLL